MGTSTARRAPSGRYWRRAKTALGRFAATGAATPKAEEVVAQYSAALCCGPVEAGELLAAMAATAANLAEFYHLWGTKGGPAALARFGWSATGRRNPGALWPFLVDQLAGAGASLAQATARTALVAHFAAHLALKAPCDQAMPLQLQPERLSRLVGDYLGRFLAASLQADLGEILEYRAPEAETARRCQAALQEEILSRLDRIGPTILPSPLPAPPELFLQSCQALITLLAREAGHE